MQRIERYGVIALIFLLVTIVAVSFWGENGEGGLWSRFTGGKAQAEPEAEVAHHDPRVNARGVARSMGNEIPLSTPGMQDAAAPHPSSSDALAERRALRRRMLEEQGQVPGRTQEDLHGLDLATSTSQEPPREAPSAERQPPPYNEPVRDAAPAPRASPLARPAPVQPAAGGTYVVQAGDTLGEIALKTLGSAKRWEEIQSINPGLDPKRLLVGAKLVLPGGSGGASTAAATPVKPASTSTPATAARPTAGRTYVVRSGDTLSRIAASQLGDAERWREIAAANPRVDPKRLFVGAQIVLPGERAGTLVAYAERTQPPERAQPVQTSAASGKPRVR